MHRGWAIRLVVVFFAVTSTWSVQEYSVAQNEGSPNSASLRERPPQKGPLSPYATRPEKAAELGLEILSSMPKFDKATFERRSAEAAAKSKAHAENLGFKSEAEVADAKLGTGLRFNRVGLKQLSELKDPNEFEKLLDKAEKWIYPIYVHGEKDVQSSITVAKVSKKEKGWRWIQRGSSTLIKKIEEYKKNEPFLVEIRGLNLLFIGAGKGSNIKLIPISNIRIGKQRFKPGEETPASTIFGLLQPEAEKVLASKRATGTGLLR